MSRNYRSHKRRRSQAVPSVEEQEAHDGANDEQNMEPSDVMEVDGPDSSRPSGEELGEEHPEEPPAEPDEELKRKQEMWEAFQEEHHEVLEQLPLSLHRSYSLTSELDQQVNNYNAQILETLKEYVALRKSLAATSTSAKETAEDAMDVDDASRKTEEAAHAESTSEDASHVAPKPTRSTRELLINIAKMADQNVRSSREKLNIARFTCGLIDRYTRDLDRAIKEQEAAISIGMRPGTHSTKIALPEILPPGPRPPKPYYISLEDDLEDELPEEYNDPPPTSPTPQPEPEEVPPAPEPTPPPPIPPPSPPPQRGRKGRKGKAHKSKSRTPHEHLAAPLEQTGQIDLEAGIPEKPTTPRRPTIRLTLSLPPAPPAPPSPEEEEPLPLQEVGANENPDEQLYCICNGPSEGMMLACDNPTCEREWYHFECLGIKRVPKGSWLCPECKEAAKTKSQAKKKKSHRRKA